jgi:hypothetical protein
VRIPIPNRDYRPWEMRADELREMGILPELPYGLWRESTPAEDYLAKLEKSFE